MARRSRLPRHRRARDRRRIRCRAVLHPARALRAGRPPRRSCLRRSQRRRPAGPRGERGQRHRHPPRRRGGWLRARDARASGASTWGHRPGGPRRQRSQDVVTANRDGTVTVLLGAGDGSFVTKGTYSSGTSASYDVVVGDLSGDSVPDVATAGGDDGVSVLRGDGTGGLLAPLRLPVGARTAGSSSPRTSTSTAAWTSRQAGTSGRTTLASRCAARGRRRWLLGTGLLQYRQRRLVSPRSGGVQAEPRRDPRPGRRLRVRGRERLLVSG